MKWERFKPAYKPIPSIKELKRNFGLTKKQALQQRESMSNATVYLNNLYEVEVRKTRALEEGWPNLFWLSIKRVDKAPIHDWRDLQRIKNELIGPEHEAVELYPAESRLVDAANQFHLWVLGEPGLRYPFGFNSGRQINTPDQAAKVGAKQRAF